MRNGFCQGRFVLNITWLSLTLLTAGFTGVTTAMARGQAEPPCRADWEQPPQYFDWAPNRGSNYVGLRWHHGSTLEEIALADPTVLKLRDADGQTWFFLTGTDTGQMRDWDPDPQVEDMRPISATNFVIYRSNNLRDWYLHSYVFNPGWQQGNRMVVPGNSVTSPLYLLQGPQLYVDPRTRESLVYLTFSSHAILDDILPEEDQATCFVVWTEKTRFLRGGTDGVGDYHWVDSDRTWMPQKYAYKINNSGAWVQDGGAAQKAANGGQYTAIPTTGNTSPSVRWHSSSDPDGFAVSMLEQNGGLGFHWAGVGPQSWMGVGPYVFFDPREDCSPWILWTWAQHSGDASLDNNNIAAFPLLPWTHAAGGYRLTDASYMNEYYSVTWPNPLFQRENTYNKIDGYDINNGRIIRGTNGEPSEWMPYGDPGGVAEAPAVLYQSGLKENGQYFISASRNPWDHPSYQIVYFGRSPGSPAPLGGLVNINYPGIGTVWEGVLLAGDWIKTYNGGRNPSAHVGYGSNDFFTAYGRTYMVFHRIDANDKWDRRVYLKDLTFTAGGWGDQGIASIWESHPNQQYDADWYLAPRVTNLGTEPAWQ